MSSIFIVVRRSDSSLTLRAALSFSLLRHASYCGRLGCYILHFGRSSITATLVGLASLMSGLSKLAPTARLRHGRAYVACQGPR